MVSSLVSRKVAGPQQSRGSQRRNRDLCHMGTRHRGVVPRVSCPAKDLPIIDFDYPILAAAMKETSTALCVHLVPVSVATAATSTNTRRKSKYGAVESRRLSDEIRRFSSPVRELQSRCLLRSRVASAVGNPSLKAYIAGCAARRSAMRGVLARAFCLSERWTDSILAHIVLCQD